MQLERYLHKEEKEKLHVFCLLSLTSKVMLSSASGAETFKPRADAEERNTNRETEKTKLIMGNMRGRKCLISRKNSRAEGWKCGSVKKNAKNTFSQSDSYYVWRGPPRLYNILTAAPKS